MRHFSGLTKIKQLTLLHQKKVPHLTKSHSPRHNTKLIKGHGMCGGGMIGRGAFNSKNWEPVSGGKIHPAAHKKHLRPLVFRK